VPPGAKTGDGRQPDFVLLLAPKAFKCLMRSAISVVDYRMDIQFATRWTQTVAKGQRDGAVEVLKLIISSPGFILSKVEPELSDGRSLLITGRQYVYGESPTTIRELVISPYPLVLKKSDLTNALQSRYYDGHGSIVLTFESSEDLKKGDPPLYKSPGDWSAPYHDHCLVEQFYRTVVLRRKARNGTLRAYLQEMDPVDLPEEIEVRKLPLCCVFVINSSACFVYQIRCHLAIYVCSQQFD
jgi:hypothetical protein